MLGSSEGNVEMSSDKKKESNRILLSVPPILRRRLKKDAKSRDVSEQALILEFCGEKYGLKIKPPAIGRPKKSPSRESQESLVG